MENTKKMTTRSLIGLEQDKGKYLVSLCICDGYLTRNGAILFDHYTNKEKLEELLELGKLLALEPKLNPNPDYPHSARRQQLDITIAYGRDVDEQENEPARELSIEEIDKEIEADKCLDYIYLFGKDNIWRFFTRENRELRSLEKGIEEEFKGMGIRRPKNIYGWYPFPFVRKLKLLQKEEDEQLQREQEQFFRVGNESELTQLILC